MLKRSRRAFVAVMTLALLAVGPADAKDPLVYVALGDSYTSGPLVMPHDTRWVPQDCGQSMRNYPHLVALLINADVFRDVSCGGANIDDFSGFQKATLGSKVRPQYEALTPNVDVVTVGIGGNDVGMAGDAVDCVRIRPNTAAGGEPNCRREFTRNGGDAMSDAIVAMQAELEGALAEIHRRAPRAKVYVVSYPTALPDNRKACWPYMPIRQPDMTYLVQKFKQMNRALRSAASRSDATYVDIYTPSIGHDACKPAGLAWINGVVMAPPSFPAHPNELSYLNSAPVVAKAIKRQL